MSEDEDHMCPICCGPMDKTDYRLFPCPCGFQVYLFNIDYLKICMWCLNTLEAEKDRCPNCRAPYNKENYRIVDEPKSYVANVYILTSLTTNEETTGNTHNKSIDVEKRNVFTAIFLRSRKWLECVKLALFNEIWYIL